jgi:glutamine synthetase
MGFEIQIGIEIEFHVLFKDTLMPYDDNIDCNLHSLVNNIDDFEEIYQKMKEFDINIEVVHKECGPGQFEIVLKHGPVTKTIDDYYLAKEIIA